MALKPGRQESNQQKLHVTQMKMMRLLIHAHKTYDRYDNHVEWIKAATAKAKNTMARYGIRKWTDTQSAKKWAWAGKVAQMHEGRWTSVLLAWIPHASRPRGRPKKRWVDDINGFLTQHTGENYEGDAWRIFACSPKTWQSLSEKFVKYTVNDK